MTLNADGLLGYRGERLGTSIQFNLYLQGTGGTPAASSSTIQWSGDLYFGPWTATIGASAQENSELDLKLRLTLLGGATYSVIRTNLMELVAKAGLAGIRERSLHRPGMLRGISPDIWPARGTCFAMTAQSSTQRLISPRIRTSRTWGASSCRAPSKSSTELFADFNVGLILTDTYDSRPPESGVNNDFNMSITIGWSYRR